MKSKIIKLLDKTEFKLIGIASRLSIHKLIWLLNSKLNTNFKQADDIVYTKNKQSETINFAIYTHEENSELIYRIIENKNISGILVKQLKNIDYLLKFEGEIHDNQLNTINKNIREIENINASLIIDIKNIKQKEIDSISF